MLFSVNKLPEDDPNKSAGDKLPDESKHVIPISAKLKETIELVAPGKTVHWVSEGDWSMHQLFQHLVAKVGGPVDVWLSSYAFSEKPARMMAEYKRTGIIGRLFCVLDSRIDVRSASAFTLMQNTADRLKTCHTHAKVTVIKNESWFLVVVGSANYTTNKRYEAGIISANEAVASFHQKWIHHELST